MASAIGGREDAQSQEEPPAARLPAVSEKTPKTARAGGGPRAGRRGWSRRWRSTPSVVLRTSSTRTAAARAPAASEPSARRATASRRSTARARGEAPRCRGTRAGRSRGSRRPRGRDTPPDARCDQISAKVQLESAAVNAVQAATLARHEARAGPTMTQASDHQPDVDPHVEEHSSSPPRRRRDDDEREVASPATDATRVEMNPPAMGMLHWEIGFRGLDA